MTIPPTPFFARPAIPDGTLLARIAAEFGTPVWIYDAETIRAQVSQLRRFDVIRYAQKAGSNVHLLRLLRAERVLVDAVSAGELERALAAGYEPDGPDQPIVFTADVLDRTALRRVVELGVPVNAGSPQMLELVGAADPGHAVWLRVNPGFGHGHSRRTNTGGEHSKHGIWHEHLPQALELVDRHELELVGFHMHIGSGADYEHLARVSTAMANVVRASGRDVRAVSAGGGLSVPYAAGEPAIDTERYFETWDTMRRGLATDLRHPIRLEIEPGRFLVAGAGVLVGEVRAQKAMGANHFVLLDAGFNDLMRPLLYGAAHQVSALAADGQPLRGALQETLLAGPLCESGDVFTVTAAGEPRPIPLPAVDIGDLVVFHDAGAYGASMSSNYNSRPLAPEVLVDGGEIRLIRRRQTIGDLLALEADLQATRRRPGW